jgi:hypothetical protein
MGKSEEEIRKQEINIVYVQKLNKKLKRSAIREWRNKRYRKRQRERRNETEDMKCARDSSKICMETAMPLQNTTQALYLNRDVHQLTLQSLFRQHTLEHAPRGWCAVSVMEMRVSCVCVCVCVYLFVCSSGKANVCFQP